ncbi:hypothetical protein TNCV_2278011 [Trichonephila clavipes]|nr:hypothetical protein TNCV_2278011 [Trichonephila clavipes]
MDPNDAFSESISTTVVPVTLPEKPRFVGICCLAELRPSWHHLPRAQFKRRSKVRITPVIRRISRRPELPEPRHIPGSSREIPEPMQIPESHVPEPPVQIPKPTVQITPVPEPVQIPEPIPELYTLEPTLTDAASFDQLMSFVFGEQLAPPSQELQLLHTVPSIFDGDLISFLNEFERELAVEPMDLTIPRLNPSVKKIWI